MKVLVGHMLDEIIDLKKETEESNLGQELTSHPLMQWSNSGCGYHFSPIVQTILCKKRCNYLINPAAFSRNRHPQSGIGHKPFIMSPSLIYTEQFSYVSINRKCKAFSMDQ